MEYMDMSVQPSQTPINLGFVYRCIASIVSYNDGARWTTYDAMEFAALVALRLAPMVLCLAGAELTEVLGRLGDDVLEQFHLDPPQLLAYTSQPMSATGMPVYRYLSMCMCMYTVYKWAELVVRVCGRTSQRNVEEDDRVPCIGGIHGCAVLSDVCVGGGFSGQIVSPDQRMSREEM